MAFFFAPLLKAIAGAATKAVAGGAVKAAATTAAKTAASAALKSGVGAATKAVAGGMGSGVSGGVGAFSRAIPMATKGVAAPSMGTMASGLTGAPASVPIQGGGMVNNMATAPRQGMISRMFGGGQKGQQQPSVMERIQQMGGGGGGGGGGDQEAQQEAALNAEAQAHAQEVKQWLAEQRMRQPNFGGLPQFSAIRNPFLTGGY